MEQIKRRTLNRVPTEKEIDMLLDKEDVKDIDTEHLVKYAHCLALDLLKDKDGVYDIREYFLK